MFDNFRCAGITGECEKKNVFDNGLIMGTMTKKNPVSFVEFLSCGQILAKSAEARGLTMWDKKGCVAKIEPFFDENIMYFQMGWPAVHILPDITDDPKLSEWAYKGVRLRLNRNDQGNFTLSTGGPIWELCYLKMLDIFAAYSCLLKGTIC